MTNVALRGCFVTGTDTGVGKTLVSAAMVHLLCRNGHRAAGLKPVAAGLELVDGEWVNEDVLMLQEASSLDLSRKDIGPCQFQRACAPHIAAMEEGRAIHRPSLIEAAVSLGSRVDRLVVEGVGGFCVPFGDDWSSADLAVDFDLPVVMVVGLRLGCLNHAILTKEAVERRGLRLTGWVASVIDPGMAYPRENTAALKKWLSPVPCLGVVPNLAAPCAALASTYLIPDAVGFALGHSRQLSREVQ